MAIARGGAARNVTSSAFIKAHKLRSASSVQSALKPLLANGIVTQDGDSFRVSDWFFAYWLRRH